MSSSACCMGRHPPSPDGIAPRPAILSPLDFKLTSANTNLIPTSWSSGSRLSKPEDAAAIQAIFEEEHSDPETEVHKRISKKASITLSAVKTRLKKHLSKDSGVANSKRHSRASVGTSEEEIERRAELRRIRHKRIQEELSNEGVYDDDAKSLSTVDAPNSFGLQERASCTPGDAIPLPTLALPSLSPKDSLSEILHIPPVYLFNKRGPMLEALYYGFLSPQPTPSARGNKEYSGDWSTTMVNSSANRSRRYSSPSTASPLFQITEPNVYHPAKKRSSLPQLTKDPDLQSKRLPSIVEPGKSSWRLSFASDNRGEHLRKLSQGTKIPTLLSPEKIVGGIKPMRKWLHCQGLRSSSQAAANSDSACSVECLVFNSQTCTSTVSQDFGGVDGGGDSTNALHLHEMGISRRLASKDHQSSCSSPQLSTLGARTHQRGVSSIGANSHFIHKSRNRRQQITTDSNPLSERVPQAWGNVLESGNTIQDGTSSFYPSAANSIQPSPKSSRFSLFSLLAGSKNKSDLILSRSKSVMFLGQFPEVGAPSSESVMPAIPRSPFSQVSIPIASASSRSLPLPVTRYHRCPTVDTNSLVISETNSFHEREAELSVVKTRFAAVEAHRSPSTPRSSKFREEFNFTAAIVGETTPARLSAFSRLAKFAARGFDGPFEKKMGIPLIPTTPMYDPDELNHYSKHVKGPLNPVASPLEDDSVVGLWGNVVKRNAVPKSKIVATNMHTPGTKDSYDARQRINHQSRTKSYVNTSAKEKTKFALKGLGWGGADSDVESEEERNATDDWEAELNRVVQRAKGKSQAVVQSFTEPDRRYPASWSRFPSHDRHERMSSSKPDDRIEVKDFATNRSEFPNHGKKTLREKIQKKLIAEYEKQAAAEVQKNTEGTFGRRSSMRTAGDLEFPELEILPLHTVPLMSDEEIAEHVDEVLREEELDRKEEELDAIFGSGKKKETVKDDRKPSLVKRATAKIALRRSGSTKATGRVSCVRTSTAGRIELMPSAASLTGTPKRKGPVFKEPGEQLTSSAPRPAPTIAPPVIMPARTVARAGAGKAKRIMDGSMDHVDEELINAQIDNSQIDDGEISIADPRFYEDCIINKTPGPETGLDYDASSGEGLIEVSLEGSKKSKNRTWNGRDWERYRRQERRSLGALSLRKSTDEILCALERLEKVERENALRAAEEAWGRQ